MIYTSYAEAAQEKDTLFCNTQQLQQGFGFKAVGSHNYLTALNKFDWMGHQLFYIGMHQGSINK